jgi:hypothetical protein
MSKFFINRPIVAMVIAILMMIVGAVTIASLPVAQFPNIVPPEIQLQASYVGADAQALEQSVATPIEQQINGVDNMNYMYSLNATANSQTTMVVNFDLKTDPNTDLILTQSRQQLAAGQLPPEVSTYGVSIKKSVPEGHLRREVPWQLRVHQPQRPDRPLVRCGPNAGFRGRAVCDEALGAAGQTGEARHHGYGHRQRRAGAEQSQSCRSGGR